ncbi:hypothetical protein DFP72DRAFT_1071203 [Ephemerocybe angulata]|uniref:Uncharacterized protein n=1 Tax=Ephemerocybe angulata TaxID=980116 RepID=A0A8H6HRQ4_9AGAR|nr:hypothetical protein DFP72DRAFT_1071203 [Tulosesus angulatus]
MLYPLVVVTPLLHDVSKSSILSFVVVAHDDLASMSDLRASLLVTIPDHGQQSRNCTDFSSARMSKNVRERGIEVKISGVGADPENRPATSRNRPSLCRHPSRYFATHQIRVEASSAMRSEGCGVPGVEPSIGRSEVRFEDSVRATGAASVGLCRWTIQMSRQPWLLRAIWRLGLRRIPGLDEVWVNMWGVKSSARVGYWCLEGRILAFAVVSIRVDSALRMPSNASLDSAYDWLVHRLRSASRALTRPVCDGHRDSVALRVWAGVLIEDSIVSSAVATTRNFVAGIP